jgi:hypothetical protein
MVDALDRAERSHPHPRLLPPGRRDGTVFKQGIGEKGRGKWEKGRERMDGGEFIVRLSLPIS